MAELPKEVVKRLQTDFTFYSEQCLTIVNSEAQRVPFELNPVQVRFAKALEKQRQEGKPRRARVLKARKVGISTQVQGLIVQDCTQLADQNALIVAQDRGTGAELFKIGEMMYSNLPPVVKPPLAGRRRGWEMLFGEGSSARRNEGFLGLNSSLRVDTAQEIQAGRGFTYTHLHLSEVAFWPSVDKMIALLNAVPDAPGTLVVQESTANGPNFFHDDFWRSWRGEDDYLAFFSPWMEEPRYSRPFGSEAEKQAFIDSIGEGPYGADEPALLSREPDETYPHPVTYEQLNWRRWAIANKARGDLRKFKQEYPATPHEAFLASGKHVFDQILVSRVLERTRDTDKLAEEGLIQPATTITKRTKFGSVDVPDKPVWTPKEATGFGDQKDFWRIWEHPKPDGRYVVACDPMAGEESVEETAAYNAVQIIDHRTRKQVARYRSREDATPLAHQIYLGALLYGGRSRKVWIAVEKTGGYGLSILQKLYFDFAYPFVYKRIPEDSARTRQLDQLGWDTNIATKPLLEDLMKDLLRDGIDGIQDAQTAQELTSYIREKRGRTKPEKGHYADLLMALMIAHQVARETVIPSERPAGQVLDLLKGRKRHPVTGY